MAGGIVNGWVRANLRANHLQALTWNIGGSSGHIGKSNQSTSSRLGEESHFLVLSLLEIFKFDERLEIGLLIKQGKNASGNFNLEETK